MPASTESRREAGGGGDGVGEQGCGLPQLGHLGPAVLAPGEVLLEAGALDVVDGVDGIGAGQLVDVAHDANSHQVSQADQSVAYACLGRAERDVEHGGHLGVGVAAEVGELDRLALDVGQGGDRAADAGGLERGVCGLGGLVVVDRWVSRFQVSSRAVAASTERTRSTALRWTMVSSQPAALPRWESYLALDAPGVEVGLLGDLLGMRRVAYDAQRQAVRPGRRRVVELGEGGLVARGRLAEELGQAALASPPDGTPWGAPSGTGLTWFTSASLRSRRW